MCASRYAKAPLGVAHRFAPLRVHAAGITLSGLRSVRSHSRRRTPVAFAPYALPSGSLLAVVAPWHWSGAPRSILVSGLRPFLVCVPRPPLWASPLRGVWPCAGCPSAPKGLPHPSAPRQQQNSFLLCYQISSCLRTLFGGYRPFRPVSQRHAGLLMLAQHLFAGVCKMQKIVLHLPLHSAPKEKPASN